MFIHKAEYILHNGLRGIIAVEPGQTYAVRDILDWVKMIPLIDLAKHAGVADDASLLHAHHGIFYRLDANQLQSLCHT